MFLFVLLWAKRQPPLHPELRFTFAICYEFIGTSRIMFLILNQPLHTLILFLYTHNFSTPKNSLLMFSGVPGPHQQKTLQFQSLFLIFFHFNNCLYLKLTSGGYVFSPVTTRHSITKLRGRPVVFYFTALFRCPSRLILKLLYSTNL